MEEKKEKILLVEDDKFLSNLLKIKLKKTGFEVVRAFNGREALIKLRENNIKLIILDIILPEKNGFEVMQEINQDPLLSKIPVIIISNLAQEEDVAKGKNLGAIEYFVKSKTPIDKLVEKVKKICYEDSKTNKNEN